MEESDFVSHIEELGLSNKEARVYLAALSLGAASVQSIADRAGIKRVTAYVILDSLLGLALVTQTMKGKKTYFIAEEPTKLERLLQRRAEELSNQNEGLKMILPRLIALRGASKEALDIKVYDGRDAVQGLFKDFFTTNPADKKEVLLLSNLDCSNGFPLERDIGRSRLLYTTKRGPVYRHEQKKSSWVFRFVPFERYPVVGDIGLKDDSVLMLSTVSHRPVAIMIRNAEMARSITALFDMAWDFVGANEG